LKNKCISWIFFTLAILIFLNCKIAKSPLNIKEGEDLNTIIKSYCADCTIIEKDSKHGTIGNINFNAEYLIHQEFTLPDDMIDYYKNAFRYNYYVKFFKTIYVDEKLHKMYRDSVVIQDFKIINPSADNPCKICNVLTIMKFRDTEVPFYEFLTKELIEEQEQIISQSNVKSGVHLKRLKINNHVFLKNLSSPNGLTFELIFKSGSQSKFLEFGR
jgi:hypothetical protein